MVSLCFMELYEVYFILFVYLIKFFLYYTLLCDIILSFSFQSRAIMDSKSKAYIEEIGFRPRETHKRN